MIPFIDLQAQYKTIEDKINKRIQDVLNHSGYIMGPEVGEFEEKLQNYLGVKHAIGVSDGTTALQIALMAANIQAGDEVIVPAFTFFATAETVSILGAIPVFVDVCEDTCNLDPSKLEEKITKKTKAIMPVSLYGQCADMDEINAIAEKHNLVVIEDAAQSFGAKYKGKFSGTLSDIATTSFFPSKPLGCYGDGGAIFTNNDDLALKIREIKNHGQEKRYYHTRIGLNGRLDTIQAAILIEKLAIFEQERELRLAVAKRYDEALMNKYKTAIVKEGNESVYAQYTIRVKNRDQFQKELIEKGIPTAVHYPIPLNKQPIYLSNETYAVSELLASEVMSIPMSPYLSKEDQDKIIQCL